MIVELFEELVTNKANPSYVSQFDGIPRGDDSTGMALMVFIMSTVLVFVTLILVAMIPARTCVWTARQKERRIGCYTFSGDISTAIRTPSSKTTYLHLSCNENFIVENASRNGSVP
ncbi:hypothetical protein NE237_005706 [Protea cynaroides]|uniref:Uncharacterized protein n=1 Tax=Protea cynaroides TaxID=273540 RepID=A0A9Q0KL01_9MAGN|nr:hypothetical protein NE237_005706 [Protea cynaroides]